MNSAAKQLNIKNRIERSFALDIRRVYKKEMRYAISQMENGKEYQGFYYCKEIYAAIDKNLRRIARVVATDEFTASAFNAYCIKTRERQYANAVNSFNKMSQAALTKSGGTVNSVAIDESVNFANVSDYWDEEIKRPERISWIKTMTALILLRSLIIAHLQTQESYEAAKLMGAYAGTIDINMATIIGGAIAAGDISSIVAKGRKKIWRSIKIETTRDAHFDADGQEVDINEPFIVGGQMLMYPGDSTNGATLDNIINCYCSVDYKD